MRLLSNKRYPNAKPSTTRYITQECNTNKELKNLHSLKSKCEAKKAELDTLRDEFSKALISYAVFQVTAWEHVQTRSSDTIVMRSDCRVDKSLYELVPWGGVHLQTDSDYLELDVDDQVLILEVNADELESLHKEGLIPDVSKIIAEQKSTKLSELKSKLSDLLGEIAKLEDRF